MFVITRSCVLLFFISTLELSSQECTRQDYLTSPDFDPNLDITTMEARYDITRKLEGLRVGCKSGYRHPPMLFCSSGGWLSFGEKCQETTCKLPLVFTFLFQRAGSFDPPNKLEFRPGETVTVSCDRNFHIRKTRTTSAVCTCGQDGSWDIKPECQESTCAWPVYTKGTSFSLFPKFVYKPGDTVTVTCDEKYYIQNPQTTSAVSTCGHDGNWDITPECQEVTCSNKPGSHVRSFGMLLLYTHKVKWRMDDFAWYWCDVGYKPTTFQAKCTRSGWTPEHLCEAAQDCEGPPPLEYGDTTTSVRDVYKHGEKVEYACRRLHKLEGESFKTCNDGTWTGEMRCFKPCTVTSNLMDEHNLQFASSSAEKQYVEHGKGLSFTCKTGKSLVGSVPLHSTCTNGVILLPSCE